MNIKSWLLTLCVSMASLLSGRCQSIDVGPMNISRVEGESMVVIPCPYIGQFSVIWEINGVLYEPLDMPLPYLAISSGLLIPQVRLYMDGHSFRCYYPTGNGPTTFVSSIGFLHVEDIDDYSPDLLTILSNKLILDNQRLYFGDFNKTFAWIPKNMQSANNDNTYQMESKERCCTESTIVNTWNDIDGTNITLPNDDLENNGDLVYFNISDMQADLKLDRLYQINASVTTEQLEVSISTGIEIDLEMKDLLTLRLAVKGCNCPLAFDSSCLDFTKTCIKDTDFIHSFQLCNTIIDEGNETRTIYTFKITNLTLSMDNSRLHFFKSKNCLECNPPISTSYLIFVRSYEIHIVIPEKPKVRIYEDGEICILSQNGVRNLPDFYDITIYDITGEIIERRGNVPRNISDCVSFGNVFYSNSTTVCAPFNITVSARNSFATTEESFSGPVDEIGDVCSCLNTRVFARLSNVTPSKESIMVEIFCNHSDFLSDVIFKVTVDSVEKSVTLMCDEQLSSNNNESEKVVFDDLECNREYNISVYWISPNISLSTQCFIDSGKAKTDNCTGNKPNAITIGVSVGVSVGLLFLILLCIIMLCVCKFKRSIRTRICCPQNLGKYSTNSDDKDTHERAAVPYAYDDI